MRHLIKLVFTLLILIISSPCYSVVKSGIEYQIPIDYSKLPDEELETRAGFYYNLALKSENANEEITCALNLYTMLQRKNPANVIYSTRLGILYDLIGKDRYAKGCFYSAIGASPTHPEPYFRLGEFYYKRGLYRKALSNYKDAYKRGYDNNFETLYKIGDIYEKLGDTEAALKYLKLASEKDPNPDLDSKIKQTEYAHSRNSSYYTNTRLHLIER